MKATDLMKRKKASSGKDKRRKERRKAKRKEKTE